MHQHRLQISRSLSNMMNTTNYTDCFPYKSTEYQAVTILSSSVACVSALACILVTAEIVYFKKYLFFTQRLILYLSIAAILNATAEILRLHSVFFNTDSGWQKRFCMASGFFEQNTTWWQLLAVAAITLSVFMKVVCSRRPEKLEVLFPVLIFILPLTFNWIPFLHYMYGQAGAWCWIMDIHTDCSRSVFGLYLRFVLWYVPLYVILVILLITYFIILFKIRSLKQKWHGRFDPDAEEQREMMAKEVRPLLWYPVFYLVLNLFPLANRIQGAVSTHPVLVLWLMQAVSSPLQGGFVSVAYALDSETIRRLNCMRVMSTCRRSPQVREYHHEIHPGVTDSLLLGKGNQMSEEM